MNSVPYDQASDRQWLLDLNGKAYYWWAQWGPIPPAIVANSPCALRANAKKFSDAQGNRYTWSLDCGPAPTSAPVGGRLTMNGDIEFFTPDPAWWGFVAAPPFAAPPPLPTKTLGKKKIPPAPLVPGSGPAFQPVTPLGGVTNGGGSFTDTLQQLGITPGSPSGPPFNPGGVFNPPTGGGTSPVPAPQPIDLGTGVANPPASTFFPPPPGAGLPIGENIPGPPEEIIPHGVTFKDVLVTALLTAPAWGTFLYYRKQVFG